MNYFTKKDSFFTLLVIIISVSHTTIQIQAASTNDIQTNLAQFEFTGTNSIDSYNNSYLIINEQINVNKTGVAVFRPLFFQSTLFWNETSSVQGGGYVFLDNLLIKQFTTIGVTNISFWIGYGSILNGVRINNYDLMKNVNLTFGFDYSSQNPDTNYLAFSNTYSFTINDFHSLSLLETGYGLVNPSLTYSNSDLAKGRLKNDSYTWDMHSFQKFINTSGNSTATQTDEFTLQFTQLNELLINYSLIGKSGNTNINFVFKNSGPISSNNPVILELIIPQQSSLSSLETYYAMFWNTLANMHIILLNHNDVALLGVGVITIFNQTITLGSDKDFFGTTLSYNYVDNGTGSKTLTSGSLSLVYHVPTGLLSSFNFVNYQNNTLINNASIILKDPNVGPIPTITGNMTNHSNGIDLTNSSLILVVIIAVLVVSYVILVEYRKTGSNNKRESNGQETTKQDLTKPKVLPNQRLSDETLDYLEKIISENKEN